MIVALNGDAEAVRWIKSLSREEILQLLQAFIDQPIPSDVDMLGDWIEDHGGKREWSPHLGNIGGMQLPPAKRSTA